MNAVTFTRALILGTLCTPAVAASESLVFDVPVQLNSDRAAVRLFAVPEPATSTLLLLGLAWLAALNRLVHPGVHRRA